MTRFAFSRPFAAVVRASAVALLVLACGNGSTTTADDVPFESAEAARQITFTTRPRVIRRTRAEYTRVQAETGQEMSDADVAELHGVWGRLGFFRRSFDVRSTSEAKTSLVGAFYSPSEKAFTVFENAEPYLLVHELVHALQDQAFDLTKIDRGAESTDELLARRAVVEGDATLSELRFLASDDPVPRLAKFFRKGDEEERSLTALTYTTLPPYFAAYASFVYPYGALYVARRDGLLDDPPTLDVHAAEDAFGAAAPRSTLDVIRVGEGRQPVSIVDVGLAALPSDLAARFEIASVDRVGMWLTHLLLQTPVRDVRDWNGDQLVVLTDHATTISAARMRGPTNVVWTTSWATTESALAFANRLDALFGAKVAADSERPVLARDLDGEAYWLEQRDTRVVLAKGLAEDALPALAAAAFAPPRATKLPLHPLSTIQRAGSDRRDERTRRTGWMR